MLRKLEILLLLYSEFLTTPKYEISAKPVLGCGRPAWSPQVVTMAGGPGPSPRHKVAHGPPAPPEPLRHISLLSRLASSVRSRIRPELVTDSVNNQIVSIYI